MCGEHCAVADFLIYLSYSFVPVAWQGVFQIRFTMKIVSRYLFSVCLLVLVSVCFARCSNKSSESKYAQLGTLLPLDETELVSDIGPYVDEVRLVPITNRNEALMSYVSKAVLDESGNIFILDIEGNVVALKPDGTLLRKVANKGRGPKEYLNVEDIAVSSDGKYLMVLDGAKLRCYGLTDTTLYKEIDVLRSEFPVDAFAPAGGDDVYLFGAFPASREDYGKSKPMLLLTDSKGRKKREYLPRKDFTVSICNITQVFGNGYILKPQDSEHVVYKLYPDSVSAYCKVDFGKKNIPANYDGGKTQIDVGEYMTATYFKLPMFFQETADDLYFKAAGPDADGYNFLYSKDKKRGIHWVDSREASPLNFIASDDTYFYAVVSKQLLSGSDDVCPLTKYIADAIRLDSGSDSAGGDNDVIVKIKFKL